LGTPHRIHAADDLEDQLCKLVLLPGPVIRDGIPSKVKELARQVNLVNHRFLTTKLPDRAAIFNLFTDIVPKQQKSELVDEKTAETAALNPDSSDQDGRAPDPVTPFTRIVHHIGHSFDAAGRFARDDVDHNSLIRGEPSGKWLSLLSDLFNVDGSREF
jgi:hypothetical protein